MDGHDSARADRRRFFSAVVLVLMVGILAPPVVEAAAKAITVKRVKQPVKITDTTGGAIDAEVVPPLGTSLAPGSSGAIAVRTFAGGGGLWGLGDCNTGTPVPGSFTVPAGSTNRVTAIIITGDDASDAAIGVQAPTVVPGGYRVVSFNAPAGTNDFVGLGNGLTVSPSELVFSCDTPGAGVDAKFVVLGQ